MHVNRTGMAKFRKNYCEHVCESPCYEQMAGKIDYADFATACPKGNWRARTPGPKKNRADYLPAIDTFPRVQAQKELISHGGLVGSELKSLLRWFKLEEKPGCKCKSRAAVMDRKGAAWCRGNIGVIVDWLGEEAAKRPFARLFYNRPSAFLLVRLAIWRAERKAHHQI